MQSPVGQVGGHLGQRGGVAVRQRAGMRQRQPSQHAVDVEREPAGPVHGPHIAEARRVLQCPQRDRRLPAAFRGLHRLTGGFDRAGRVAAGQVRAKYGWTDVSRFAARGIAAVNYGPGDPNLAHTRDELVPVDQITAAVAMLRVYLSD